MWEQDHRTVVMFCFIVGGGLLCFLTMAAKNSFVETSTVGGGIRNGIFFHIAIASSISLAVPVLMNLIVDLYVDNFRKEAKKSKKSKFINDKDIMTDVEKLFFMVGIVIFPIVSCFTGWSQAILLATCAASVQLQLVAGTVIISLNRFDAQYFPTLAIYVFMFFMTISNILRPYAINACAVLSTSQCAALPSYKIQMWFTYIAAIGLWALIVFWLFSVLVTYVCGEKVHAQYFRWPRWCCYNNDTSSSVVAPAKKKSPLDDSLLFFRISYCLTTVAYILFSGIVKFRAVTFSEFDDRGLMLLVIPHIMFEVSVIFFGLRLVKHKAVVALLALIEAKKTYVRYISHELRTPLSAANSGLQMLHAELTATASTNPVDEERLDTLTDVCSAIQTTVDILNDLLTFEKMDSGKNLHIDPFLALT